MGLTERERIAVGPVVADHARLNLAVLADQPGPATDQALLTTAALLTLLGAVEDLASGVRHVQRLTIQTVQRRLNLARSAQ